MSNERQEKNYKVQKEKGITIFGNKVYKTFVLRSKVEQNFLNPTYTYNKIRTAHLKTEKDIKQLCAELELDYFPSIKGSFSLPLIPPDFLSEAEVKDLRKRLPLSISIRLFGYVSKSKKNLLELHDNSNIDKINKNEEKIILRAYENKILESQNEIKRIKFDLNLLKQEEDKLQKIKERETQANDLPLVILGDIKIDHRIKMEKIISQFDKNRDKQHLEIEDNIMLLNKFLEEEIEKKQNLENKFKGFCGLQFLALLELNYEEFKKLKDMIGLKCIKINEIAYQSDIYKNILFDKNEILDIKRELVHLGTEDAMFFFNKFFTYDGAKIDIDLFYAKTTIIELEKQIKRFNNLKTQINNIIDAENQISKIKESIKEESIKLEFQIPLNQEDKKVVENHFTKKKPDEVIQNFQKTLQESRKKQEVSENMVKKNASVLDWLAEKLNEIATFFFGEKKFYMKNEGQINPNRLRNN